MGTSDKVIIAVLALLTAPGTSFANGPGEEFIVPVLGIMTAVFLSAALITGIFRAKIKNSFRYHRVLAFIAAALMMLHGIMAFLKD